MLHAASAFFAHSFCSSYEALCCRILDERMRLSSLRASLCCLAAAAAKQEPRALAVGASLKQSTHLAVASVENEALAYPAQRIWRVDDETSIATVGVAADARAIARATVLCLEHRATYSTPLPPSRLARALAQRFAAAAAGDRSLGVDVVVAGAGAVASVTADGARARAAPPSPAASNQRRGASSRMPSSPAWTPAPRPRTRALRLLPLLTFRSAAACSVNASCVVARRGKGQCAPVTPRCARPCGAYHVHMRGTGGKWVGEQLLNHLYYREETAFVIEGSSLRSAKATREAYACARLGSCLHLTILRHPVDVDQCGEGVLGAPGSSYAAVPFTRLVRGSLGPLQEAPER